MRHASVRVVSLITYAAVCATCGESSSTPEDKGLSARASAGAATAVAPAPTLTAIGPITAAEPEPTTRPAAPTRTSSVAAPTAVPEGPEVAVAEQVAAYEIVIRDVLMRTVNDRPRGVPGVLLVDHAVTGAGREPLAISESASGERFTGALRDELSRRLVDVPLLDLVSSMEEVLGTDYHPTATGGARPGVLVVVSPISRTGDRVTMGVQVGPPGGVGWEYVLDVTGGTATITDAQMTWIS
jgi:hypothetical protein